MGALLSRCRPKLGRFLALLAWPSHGRRWPLRFRSRGEATRARPWHVRVPPLPFRVRATAFRSPSSAGCSQQSCRSSLNPQPVSLNQVCAREPHQAREIKAFPADSVTAPDLPARSRFKVQGSAAALPPPSVQSVPSVVNSTPMRQTTDWRSARPPALPTGLLARTPESSARGRPTSTTSLCPGAPVAGSTAGPTRPAAGAAARLGAPAARRAIAKLALDIGASFSQSSS